MTDGSNLMKHKEEKMETTNTQLRQDTEGGGARQKASKCRHNWGNLIINFIKLKLNNIRKTKSQT